ncbi:MAG: DUF362 domain-containing protein [Thermodesulfobacteriota bacterium]|nr:DUF362 domain-containing protein [Thermodesulfobacteriota bacterium]
MVTPVSIVKCRRYDDEEVLEKLRLSIDLIGGIGSFVKKGDRVLLKPNLLYGKAPEKAVTTHPSIIRGVIQIVRENGGIPFLGDSPGIGNSVGVAEKAGIKRVADAMDCPVIEFNRPVLPPERKGRFFKNIEIDQAIFEADVIINLPKWKTHAQMLLTLGVKNLFGCVPGQRKALWHLKAGEDHKIFAQMLVDIYLMIQPSLTILDGIVGMEGNGPGSGDPVPLGLILASGNPLILDQIVCDLVGISRNSLMTNRVAFEQGLGRNGIEVVGERVEDVKIRHFKLPNLTRVDWNLPGFVKKAFKNALNSKPVIDQEICKLCNQCVEICPPEALKGNEKGLVFDYGKCIRCFCCQEICPEGAITIQQGWALKLVGRRQRAEGRM